MSLHTVTVTPGGPGASWRDKAQTTSGIDSLTGGRKTLGIIQGDAVLQSFIPKLIGLHRAGWFPFDRLVKFYDFSAINKAVADAKRGDTIKSVLRIRGVRQGKQRRVTDYRELGNDCLAFSFLGAIFGKNLPKKGKKFPNSLMPEIDKSLNPQHKRYS